MTKPDKAIVLYDVGTDLKSTDPICYTRKVYNELFTKAGVISLALRLNFKNTNDKIMLGAVGVKIQSIATTQLDWWKNAETYHISAFAITPGEEGQFDWGTLAQSKATFTTHCPIDKTFINRCHSMGVHCFPYIAFYIGPEHPSFGDIHSDTYNGVNFLQHDFFELDAQLNPRIVPDEWKTDGVGVNIVNAKVVCPNRKEYQDLMKDWVKYIMQQGADGIFVDVIRTRERCYASHQHDVSPVDPNDPDTGAVVAQNKAFARLLDEIRGVVKSFRADGLIIGNSGDPLNLGGISPPEFQQYRDGDTLESYVCIGQSPPNPYSIVRAPKWYYTDLKWDQFGTLLKPYLTQGKQILTISPLGDSSAYLVREDVFLTYYAARLAGFVWYGSITDSRFADLHRIRLGKPLTEQATDPSTGLRYRIFERCIVVVNWDTQITKNLDGQSIVTNTLGENPEEFRFFFEFKSLSIVTCTSMQEPFPCPLRNPTIIDTNETGGIGGLTIPAYSGRAYLFASSTDYGLNHLT